MPNQDPQLKIQGELLEAKGPRFRVRVIRAGKSHNGRHYPPETLRAALPLFEGKPVMLKSDEEHGAVKHDIRNLIGSLTKPAWNETEQAIEATLVPVGNPGGMVTAMETAIAEGAPSLIGFSITAKGKDLSPGPDNSINIGAISSVESLDMVMRPSAGGQLLSLTEAVTDPVLGRAALAYTKETAMKSKMLEAIKEADATLLESLPEETDATYEDKLLEAYQAATAPKPEQAPEATPTAVDQAELLKESLQLVEARGQARGALASTDLPEASKKRISEWITEADYGALLKIAERIEAEREHNKELGLGPTPSVGQAKITEAQGEKYAKMLDALLDPQDMSMTSLRDAYTCATGDVRVDGTFNPVLARHMMAAHGYVTEAIQTSTWAEILSDRMNKRLLALYDLVPAYRHWEAWCTVTSPTDFLDQRIDLLGGYGDLPEVAEAGLYTPATSPQDTEETYTVKKYGHIETVTREAIANDRLGAVQSIPQRLAMAGVRNVSKDTVSILTSNTNFTAARNNLLVGAGAGATGSQLSAETLNRARLAMMNQVEPGSNKKLGIPPSILIVPFELERTAYDLFRRDTNNDPTFINSQSYRIVTVPDLTNAATHWYVMPPAMRMGAVIGFLNGRRAPRIIPQSAPNVGKLFTNDQYEWKVEHIYGVGVGDYRAMLRMKGAA